MPLGNVTLLFIVGIVITLIGCGLGYLLGNIPKIGNFLKIMTIAGIVIFWGLTIYAIVDLEGPAALLEPFVLLGIIALLGGGGWIIVVIFF